MPVNYTNILQGIRQAIINNTDVQRHDSNISERVYVEQPLTLEGPSIFIYRDRRDALASEQRIAQGRRVDYDLAISVWCTDYDFDSVEKASERTDALVGVVEMALLNDRTLGGTVDYFWIAGGEFISGEDNGFYSAAEIALTARVHATT